MCFDPISMAFMAAQVAGTAMNNSAQNKSARRNSALADQQLAIAERERVRGNEAADAARRKILVDEPARQAALDAERRKVFETTLPNFSVDTQNAAREAAGERAAARMDALMADQPQMQMPMGASDSVKSVFAKAAADSLARGKEQAKRAARLQSWDDANFGNTLALGGSSQKIGTLNDFARGSAGVLPFEVNVDNTRIAGSNQMAGAAIDGAQRQLSRQPEGSTFGDILSGVGQMGTFARFAGMGPNMSWGQVLGRKPQIPMAVRTNQNFLGALS